MLAARGRRSPSRTPASTTSSATRRSTTALTGLANRALFRDRVDHAVERRRGPRRPAIRGAVPRPRRLQDAQRQPRPRRRRRAPRRGRRADPGLPPARPTPPARLGGDEFAILLEDVDDETGGGDRRSPAAPRGASRQPIGPRRRGADRSRASIGIALSGPAATTADELLRNADVAMYAAKRGGKRPVRGLPAGPARGGVRARASWRRCCAAPRRATSSGSTTSRSSTWPTARSSGVEALVRWQPPGRGLLMPADFIGLAEETGRHRPDRPLGPRAGLPPTRRPGSAARPRRPAPVSVNLSARQFQRPGPRRRCRRGPRGDRPDRREPRSSRSPRAVLMQPDRDDDRQARPSCARLGRPPRDRRLRDGLLVARLPRALPGRHPEDRPVVHRRASASAGDRPRPRPGDRRAGPGTRPRRSSPRASRTPTRPTGSRALGCRAGQGYLFSRPLGVDAMEMFLAADATRCVQEGDTAERDVTSAKPGPRRRRASAARLRLVSGE